MGHAIGHIRVEANASRATIIERCSDWTDCNKDHQESPGRSHVEPELIDRVFDNEDDAMAYLDAHDHTYRQYGVKFYSVDDLVPSAKLTRLYEKRKELYQKWFALSEARYLSSVTSKFVGCKKCGSKFNREMALPNRRIWNNCPVCDADFRSQTTLARIKRAKELYEQVCGEVEAEKRVCEQKQRKNAKVYWLIKLECHC